MYIKTGIITSTARLENYGYVIVTDDITKTTGKAVYVPSTCKYTLAVNDAITYLYDEDGCALYVSASGWGTVTAYNLQNKVNEYCLDYPSYTNIQNAITNSTGLYIAVGLSSKEAASLKKELYTLGCTSITILRSYCGLFLFKSSDKVPQTVEDFVTKSYVETNFLSQSDASNTYLTKTDASNTYLRSKDASRIYVYKTDLETLYYTAAQVDGLIPTKTSQLTNDSDFVTSTAVANNYLNKTTAAATYATRSDVESTYLKQSDASSTYLTQEAALDNYLLQQDAASTYATKTSIPTKVSQLTNDAGFITGTYIASNYYNMVQVDAKVSDVKDAIPTKVSQLENDAGYITEGGGSFRNHVHQLIGDATIANMALSVAQKAVMKSYYTGKVIE